MITTDHLPEAYYLIDFLHNKKQIVSLINIEGRSTAQKSKIFLKLIKNRGGLYFVDLLFGRLLQNLILDPSKAPFPHINDSYKKHLMQGISCLQCKDVHAPETLSFISQCAPDYLLLAGAPVLKKAVYALAKKGTINRHLGISPEYRGSDCPLWCIARSDIDKIGYTVHFLSDVVDGGEVILQEKVDITQTTSLSEALALINFSGSKGFSTVLEKVIRGEHLSTTRQGKGGHHYPPAGLSVLLKAHFSIKKMRN